MLLFSTPSGKSEMLGRRPPIDSLPGGYRPHKRSSSLLKTPRSDGNLDWDRLMAIILGVATFLLFCGFMVRGQAIGEASRNVNMLQEQLAKYQQEISQLRSSVSHYEQEVDAKEMRATALSQEVNQVRAQSDRLDGMIEGYRGQVHRMEVQLSKKERECKVREEELEATVSKEVSLKTASEQRVADELKVSHGLMLKVNRLEKDLEGAKGDLAKCEAGDKVDMQTHSGLEQHNPTNDSAKQEGADLSEDASKSSKHEGDNIESEKENRISGGSSDHSDVLG